MIECRFITVEDDPPDQIVSLSCAREVDDQENDIMILRTPPHEWFMPEEERGAMLSLGYADEPRALLEWVHVDGDVIEFKAGPIHEKRDCRRVDPEELQEALGLLRKMNRDNAFEITGP